MFLFFLYEQCGIGLHSGLQHWLDSHFSSATYWICVAWSKWCNFSWFCDFRVCTRRIIRYLSKMAAEELNELIYLSLKTVPGVSIPHLFGLYGSPGLCWYWWAHRSTLAIGIYGKESLDKVYSFSIGKVICSNPWKLVFVNLCRLCVSLSNQWFSKCVYKEMEFCRGHWWGSLPFAHKWLNFYQTDL